MIIKKGTRIGGIRKEKLGKGKKMGESTNWSET